MTIDTQMLDGWYQESNWGAQYYTYYYAACTGEGWLLRVKISPGSAHTPASCRMQPTMGQFYVTTCLFYLLLENILVYGFWLNMFYIYTSQAELEPNSNEITV